MRLRESSLFTSTNLQGHWALDGNFNDSSANGYNLTAVNSPTAGEGRFGGGYDFEHGSGQYASIANASCPNLEITGSKSYVAWVKPESLTPADNNTVMAKTNAANTLRNRFMLQPDGSVYLEFTGLTTTDNITTATGLITTGVWYHLAGVYNSATTSLKIYINGIEVQTATASGSSSDTNGDFAIGRNGGQNLRFFDGLIDDVAVFNRALTQPEIMSLVADGGAFLLNFI